MTYKKIEVSAYEFCTWASKRSSQGMDLKIESVSGYMSKRHGRVEHETLPEGQRT
jgi:hypothetical protein